jgi:hypothetical protein
MGAFCSGGDNGAPTPKTTIKRSVNTRSHDTQNDDSLRNSFTVVWLDKESQQISTIAKCLEITSDQITTFRQVAPCQTHMENQPNDRFILVAENELASEIVPEIDELPQLIIVFVFSRSGNPRKQWIQHYQTKFSI